MQDLHRFKADIFQALAHPTRVAIVEALREDERSAGQLTELLGLEQANASQHFAVLRSKQVVTNQKKATRSSTPDQGRASSYRGRRI